MIGDKPGVVDTLSLKVDLARKSFSAAVAMLASSLPICETASDYLSAYMLTCWNRYIIVVVLDLTFWRQLVTTASPRDLDYIALVAREEGAPHRIKILCVL